MTTTTASATESRIHSMGGGVKLWTVEDESNIFDFPSLLTRWGNRVYIDNLQPGADGDELFPNGRFGFHYNLSDDTVLAFIGVHANSSTRGAGNGFNIAGNAVNGLSTLGVAFQASQATLGDGQQGTNEGMQFSGDAIGNTDFRYGIMFGTQLGASTRFGVMLNFAGDDGDVDSPGDAEIDQGAMLFDLAIGLGVDLSGSELELSAGLELGFFDDARDELDAGSGQPGDLLEHFTGSHFGLRINGRWTFDFFDQTKIVTYAQFAIGSQSVELSNALTPVPQGSWSGLGFTLGADLRIEPFQDVVVSPGLGILIAQQTLEGRDIVDRDADLLLGLPFYGIAVDLKLASWFDLRFGAQQFVSSLRQSQTANGTTVTGDAADVFTTFAWGFGLNLPVAESTLALDFSINPAFFTNGPHVLTGNATGAFAFNAAARYNW
ncbi:MAG: hypothetical protein IT385_01535 [Deltaproteobacteria bacterium]|nr:hypothetical protein [Deltaproteobacteria bacterium]